MGPELEMCHLSTKSRDLSPHNLTVAHMSSSDVIMLDWFFFTGLPFRMFTTPNKQYQE